MQSNISDAVRNIVPLLKTTGLALLWGGLSGLIGLALVAMNMHKANGLDIIEVFGGFEPTYIDALVILAIVNVFGGFGLLVTTFHANMLWLPIIHCIYAFIILHYKLRGIISVMSLHYLFAIFIITIWIAFNVPDSKGSVSLQGTINYYFWTMQNATGGGNLLMWAMVDGVRYILITVTTLFYNGLLFFFLWRAIKNHKRNASDQNFLSDGEQTTEKQNIFVLFKESFKTIGLALVIGGISGFHGLGGSGMGDGIAVFGLIGIFGGIGLLLTASHASVLCLPIIHCVYAYIILRFKLRGILTVMALHYISAILITTVWISLDLPSFSRSIGLWTAIQHDIFVIRERWHWDNLIFCIVTDGFRYSFITGLVILYNVILLVLFRWTWKKRDKSASMPSNVN